MDILSFKADNLFYIIKIICFSFSINALILNNISCSYPTDYSIKDSGKAAYIINHTTSKIHIVDLQEKKYLNYIDLSGEGMMISSAAISNNGNTILGTLRSRPPWKIFKIDTESNSVTNIIEVNFGTRNFYAQDLVFTPSDDTIIVSASDQFFRGILWIKTSDLTVCDSMSIHSVYDNYDIQRLALSEDGKYLALVASHSYIDSLGFVHIDIQAPNSLFLIDISARKVLREVLIGAGSLGLTFGTTSDQFYLLQYDPRILKTFNKELLLLSEWTHPFINIWGLFKLPLENKLLLQINSNNKSGFLLFDCITGQVIDSIFVNKTLTLNGNFINDSLFCIIGTSEENLPSPTFSRDKKKFSTAMSKSLYMLNLHTKEIKDSIVVPEDSSLPGILLTRIKE